MTKFVDAKFLVQSNYAEKLQQHRMVLASKETILDKYFDTRELKLLQAGMFLRSRNNSLELKVLDQWHGNYQDYKGVTEFHISTNEQIEEILKMRLNANLSDMTTLCTIEFEREYWSCINYKVVIDAVKLGKTESVHKIGEIKLENTDNKPLDAFKEEVSSYLRELDFEQIEDGKLAIKLKDENYPAYLKLKNMM